MEAASAKIVTLQEKTQFADIVAQRNVVTRSMSTSRSSTDPKTTYSVDDTRWPEENQDDTFIKVPPKRRRPRPKPITGTGSSLGSLKGAPEPSRDIFVYRIMSEVTDDELTKYIDDQGVPVKSVELKSNAEALFKSYRVEVTKSCLQKVLVPEFWPEGVCVRRYFGTRPNPNRK